MDKLSRIVVGYHGCEEEFARNLLLESVRIPEWKSQQEFVGLAWPRHLFLGVFPHEGAAMGS